MKVFLKGFQFRYFILLALFQALQSVNGLIAQTPTHIPREGKPVDFIDTTNIIVFIVLPLVIVILYFLWRKQRAKQKAQEDKNTKSESGE
jgi:heme/copper-type cytochrome/quinol oxidase subunit 2